MKLPIIEYEETMGLLKAQCPGATRIVLPDTKFKLPSVALMREIYDVFWKWHVKLEGLTYISEYDCDNFSLSYYNLIAELRLGLCVGEIYYSFQQNGKWLGHAVGCFIGEDKKFYMVEPQSEEFNYHIPVNTEYLDFIKLEGII